MSRKAGIAAAATDPNKRRRGDEGCDATAAVSPLGALSDEDLLRALAFADKRGVFAAAGACRRWRAVIHGEGSASLWRGLVETFHPVLLEAESCVARTPSAGWRALFLRTERLVALVDDRLSDGLARFAKSVRNGRELYGSESDRRDAPYKLPATGTTATARPDAHGVFSEPVYYDWDANWDLVSYIVPTEPVQAALKRCIDGVSDGYYFDSWNEDIVWPFFFMDVRRNRIGEQRALMKKFLPRALVRKLNDIVAEWFEVEGRFLLCDQYYPDDIAETLVAKELKSGVTIGEDEIAEEMEDVVVEMMNKLYHMIHEDEDGRDLVHKNTETAEAVLYETHGPLRAILLCTVGASNAFVPLNYALAKLLSPEDADLKVYASEVYSVVVDERRNIVFDNFWYFCGRPASVTLESARDRPQLG